MRLIRIANPRTVSYHWSLLATEYRLLGQAFGDALEGGSVVGRLASQLTRHYPFTTPANKRNGSLRHPGK